MVFHARRPWANRQTEIVWDWIQKHPDLAELLRATAERADGDLAGHVADYLLPINPDFSTQASLAHSALDGVDWGQLRRRLIRTGDGNDP